MIANKKKNLNPLVSVGFPVRNGEKTLKKALNSILKQTETNFEIIISDNNSIDNTASIIKKMLIKESRIKYYRQKKTLTIFKNFDFVLRKSKGKYFLWIAHDDYRDKNYIKKLICAIDDDESAILAFGDLQYLNYNLNEKIIFDFHTENKHILSRMAKTAFIQCFHIYGVWKTDKLKKLSFFGTSWWGDLPFMLSACCLGTFKYVSGTNFYYFNDNKLSKERIYYQDLKSKFNLFFVIMSLIQSGYKSSSKVGGVILGIISSVFIILRILKLTCNSLFRRISNLF